jgi:hypothetical protein
LRSGTNEKIVFLLALFFPRAPIGFERFAHARYLRAYPRTVMGGLDGTLGHLGDPLHLIAKRPPAIRVGDQTGKGLKGAEHSQHDGDIVIENVTPTTAIIEPAIVDNIPRAPSAPAPNMRGQRVSHR